MSDAVVSTNEVPGTPAVPSQTGQWNVPYYVKGLALGIPIYFVAIHLWAWVLIVPGFLRAGRPDFRQIYSSAYMVRTGYGSQLYDYSIQKEFQDKLVSHQDLALPFIRPAYEALLFSPLSHFSFRQAYLLFAGFNALCLGACFLLLKPWTRNLQAVYPWLPVAMLFGFYPIAWAFVMGQDSVLLLALLIGAFVLLTRQKALVAGLLSGLGLFKFQVLLPVAVLFVCWRRWRFLCGFGISAALVGFASVWTAGISGTKEYFEYLTSIANPAHAGVSYPVLWQMMANLHGLVFGLTSTWLPRLWLGLLSLVLAVIVLSWTVCRGMRLAEDANLFLLALPCSILIGHYAFMHDLTVLILPTFVLLDHFLPSESRDARGERWIGRAAVLMFVAPVIDSFFPNHTYLAALAVAGLLFAVAALRVDTARQITKLAVPIGAGRGGNRFGVRFR